MIFYWTTNFYNLKFNKIFRTKYAVAGWFPNFPDIIKIKIKQSLQLFSCFYWFYERDNSWYLSTIISQYWYYVARGSSHYTALTLTETPRNYDFFKIIIYSFVIIILSKISKIVDPKRGTNIFSRQNSVI